MTPDPSCQPGPSSSSSGRTVDHATSLRRLFLGPTPHYTMPVQSRRQEEEEASEFVSQHGLRIFLQQGGCIEDWTEAKAHEYKERLKQNILESLAWYALEKSVKKRKFRKGMMPTIEWRGNSYEIGKVLGVGINLFSQDDSVHEGPSVIGRSSSATERATSATTIHWDDSTQTAYVTANSTLSGSEAINSSETSRPHLQSRHSAPLAPIGGASEDSKDSPLDETEGSTSSRTPLFLDPFPSPAGSFSRSPVTQTVRESASDGALSNRARSGFHLKSILAPPGFDKGKKKAVRYAPSPRTPFSPSPSGNRSPAPPEQVLNRVPDETQATSAAAAAETLNPEPVTDTKNGDQSILRDRMLVRVFECEHDKLGHPFTEDECRITRGLDRKEWDEFLVVWKKRRIELYEDHHTPCKERFVKRKHLAFVIPLTLRTKLSLFSFNDASFCLICPQTPTEESEKKHHNFFRRSNGLRIFIMKAKSRSRSIDWLWNLWSELDGELPSSFEVRCPLVHSRVRIPIPNKSEIDWTFLSRDNIIDICSGALEKSSAWNSLVQFPMLNGKRLELCWRYDMSLDWVWLKDDVGGARRDWEVLFGLLMHSPGIPSHLELHLASHYPSAVRTKGSKHTDEPPSIEGFVHLIKRKTQAHVQYYLSTHDHHICAVTVNKVETPPTQFDLQAFSKGGDSFREDEAARLRLQIMNARGLWDMRNIVEVRRAVFSESTSPGVNGEHSSRAEQPAEAAQIGNETEVLERRGEGQDVRRTNSDLEDIGGEAGYTATADRARLKIHRTFEIVLKSGRILRFEAHSTSVAIEWVTHLGALVEYWKERLHSDAITEMNIHRQCHPEKVVTGERAYSKLGHAKRVKSSNPEQSPLHMDDFWNWCVINGCRQVVKSGRLYMKSKLRGQYRHAHLILVRGCLVQFKVSKHGSMLNHQIGRANLVDAYVCSGYYAALVLPPGEYDPNAPPLAKLYSDGLETRDTAEDTLFMLWYRPHTNYSSGDLNRIPIISLSAKYQVLIFRARSKLERDAWCWALNCEIEKLVRETREREDIMRGRAT